MHTRRLQADRKHPGFKAWRVALTLGLAAVALSACGKVHSVGPLTHVPTGGPVAPPVGNPVGNPVGSPTTGTPGIAAFFTSAYAGTRAGQASPSVLSANAAASQANPNNPDRVLSALIDSARSSLEGAFYDIEVDDVVSALVRAKQRGVAVRLVTENDYYVDSHGQRRAPIQKLEAAGIKVVPDDRAGLMHDKFLVVDRQRVWSGSYNITTGGSYHDNNNGIRLDSVALAGVYDQEFEKMVGGDFGQGNHPGGTPVQIGAAQVTPYFSPNATSTVGPKAAIMSELKGARRSIKFMAFSFTDAEMGATLAERAGAGVAVSGSFDKTQAAGKTSQDKVLGRLASVDVRISTNPALMHHKVFLIDDSTVITGSFNFSSNAQKDNDENLLVIKNAPAIAAAYLAEFGRVMAASTPEHK